ncbi:sugar ABC transporter permease [Paenibacillus sp. MY03]|jgi:putative aldouronate transport system permease protein|uniref:Sugar ABC transporter permease n=1 Tax=Paenibacillus agaridevorans TaxID=171404 RepID=A0A2R5EKS7_9BACL|nr:MULTISPECIES: carbohydrate ABC transporter permease [Paenibacillus]OUS76134.1 sugar ABC transporter permease [Paenibacillus sp. MY03]QNK57876.1 carbohydrate ABC transporter permease [Paenibacillus sp. PAMC21692]GBG07246.1 sugar ABC transporter permease [Paenibacillus agaridevorans]
MKKFSLSKTVMYALISIYSAICFIPMLLVLMISITDEDAVLKNGYSLFPEKFSLYAYKLIFTGGSQVMQSYTISIFVTVVGTLLAILVTSMAGYTLANKHVKYRNLLALYFFITMIFSAGIVPWYMMNRMLGLTDNILALIIPSLLFSPFNLFLVRNFMNGVPDSLRESATIDGANDITIAFRIYLPLCTPVLATIALFYGLDYWNNWWNAIMLIDDQDLYPLQFMLLQLQSEISMLNEMTMLAGTSDMTLPSESVKMATAIVTIGPIVFLYPYLQKYFVKGLVIGSVKG